MSFRKISVIGVVGVPANYGGFETLVDNLVKYHERGFKSDILTVYCSSKAYHEKQQSYLSAQLKYIPLHANGVQSIPYDFISLISAVWNRNDVILLLGVSGAIALPFVRMLSSAKVVTNIDGIEWRREKWCGLAKKFLRFSERVAVRYSDEVISDNAAIAAYVRDTYGINSHVIAYGGDHAVGVDAVPVDEYSLPDIYAFSVCRIEPENNVHVIVEAFSAQEEIALVLVGNWENSDYGCDLRNKYRECDNLYLLDPIYDLGKLKALRSKAAVYLHGHSAGGTNPSLVEAMHFGVPIIAFDCDFNRSTTENKALYFSDLQSLLNTVAALDEIISNMVGQDMVEIAQRRYTWDRVAEEYFALLK